MFAQNRIEAVTDQEINHSGYQEPGDHKENVDADKAARRAEPKVKRDDAKNSDGPQPIDIPTVFYARIGQI